MERAANKILIANITMPEANKEYSWALPQGCQWFTLQVRDGTPIRIAFESGHVANSEVPYFTLLANNAWDERQFQVDISHGLPFYFACSIAGKVIEALLGIYDVAIGGEE